jgi:hypothetical protein
MVLPHRYSFPIPSAKDHPRHVAASQAEGLHVSLLRSLLERVTRTRDSSGATPATQRPGFVRRWALWGMCLAAAGYVAFHTPARSLIAAVLGRDAQGCYLCLGSLPPSLTASASAWLLIGMAAVAGLAVSASWRGVFHERLVCLLVTCTALIVVPSSIVGLFGSWLGQPLLRPPLGPLIAAIPSAILILRAVHRRTSPFVWVADIRLPQSPLARILAALAGALLAASVVLHTLRPPDGGDALTYHAALAAFLWDGGTLTAPFERAPDMWALAHPGGAEIWYGLLRVAGGERLADLGQLPFALLGAAGVATFAAYLGAGRAGSRIAGLAFLLSTLVVMQSTTQANDVMAGSLLIAAVALASASDANWTRDRLLLVAVAGGLVAAMKLALLPSLLGLAAFVLITQFRSRSRERGGFVGAVLIGTVGVCLAAGPWWVRNALAFGNPLYPAAIPLLGGGIPINELGSIDSQFVPTALAWPLFPFLEPHNDRSGFGALLILIVPGLVFALQRAPRRPLFALAATAATTLPAWWALTLHEPRFLLPLLGLALAFVPWSIRAVGRAQRRWAVVLVAGMAVFSAIVTVDQALVPLARQPESRVEFYDRVWGVDPFVLGLAEGVPLLWHTGYGHPRVQYAAYYPLLGPSAARRVIEMTAASTEEVLVAMESNRIQCVYVTATADARETVARIYDKETFDVVHESYIKEESSTSLRPLFKTAEPSDDAGIARYVFALRQAPGACGPGDAHAQVAEPTLGRHGGDRDRGLGIAGPVVARVAREVLAGAASLDDREQLVGPIVVECPSVGPPS